MLLQLTTHRTEILFRVKNDPVHKLCEVRLPAGTYIFQRSEHPIDPNADDWVIIDQIHLIQLGLEPGTIVGMSYEYLALANLLAHSFSFYDPNMMIDVQEIASVISETEATVTTTDNTAAVKMATNIIPWPIDQHLRFSRHDQAHSRPIRHVAIHDRLKRLHPAARRVC